MIGPGVKLALHDDRRALSPAAFERIAEVAATLAPLVRREPPAARSCEPAKEMLERGKRPNFVEANTVAELALRFVIDRDAIAMPRMHRREHLGEALVAAGATSLTPELMTRLLDANLALES
jgi:aryl-alcohol dehydrogenase-like predicted oxidoreductase